MKMTLGDEAAEHLKQLSQLTLTKKMELSLRKKNLN